MSKHLTAVRLFTALFLSTHLSLAQTSNKQHIELESIYQLQKINLDSWTEILFNGSQGTATSNAKNSIQKIIMTSNNEQQMFSLLNKMLKQLQLQNASDYLTLSQTILEARQELRSRINISNKAMRDSLFLLELLAEESLYVGSKKFPNFANEISIKGNLSTNAKSKDLRGFEVQTADVVVSKATGAGSSSFIALSMSHPHIFSHSTPIYIDAQNRLLTPEAEIEDGVKLREMTKDYINGSKTRLYIYRYDGKDKDVISKVISSSEEFISEMYKRAGDPFTKAAYTYDFSMQPGDIDNRGLFCSSVAYEIYNRAKLGKFENPYDKALWSPVTSSRKVLLGALDMNTNRVPAPGDVELNPNFKLVGARIDITKLNQDRIEMAIIDSFMQLLETNKDIMKQFSSQLELVGNQKLDKVKLKELFPQFSKKIEQIPDSINAKQLLFFAFLNEVLTPKIRSALLLQIEDIEKTGKIVGPQQLRTMATQANKQMLVELKKYQSQLENYTAIQSCSTLL